MIFTTLTLHTFGMECSSSKLGMRMDLHDFAKQVSNDLEPSSTATIIQPCVYHHYCCDGFDDKVVYLQQQP